MQGAQRDSPRWRYRESFAPQVEHVPGSQVLAMRLAVTQPAV
jgi:hypothetical protein